jgi:predicted transcriptional regulator
MPTYIRFLLLAALQFTALMKQIKMASKNVTTVDTRAELAELVKRKAEIAVWIWCIHAVNVVLGNTVVI